MIALLYTDHILNASDVKYECRSQKWFPLLSYTLNEGSIKIPVFMDHKTAKNFSIRNLPKNCIKGSIDLLENDLEFIDKNNWKIELFNFPKKIIQNLKVKLLVSILELSKETGFKVEKL